MNLRDKLIYNCQQLERNRIHVLYWEYDFSFYNIYHSPLLLGSKILGWIKRDKGIDHVCHISRFVHDEELDIYRPKIFEASVELDMGENDLIEKCKHFRGTLYIESLKIVNKKIAKKFEKDFKDVRYSKNSALFSGVDLPFFKESKRIGFCSWLEAIFLKRQGYKIRAENGNPSELTPLDIYNEGLGIKQLFYKYAK